MKKITAFVPDDAATEIVVRLMASASDFFVETVAQVEPLQPEAPKALAPPPKKPAAPAKNPPKIFRDPSGMTLNKHIMHLLRENGEQIKPSILAYGVGVGYKEASVASALSELLKANKVRRVGDHYSLMEQDNG